MCTVLFLRDSISIKINYFTIVLFFQVELNGTCKEVDVHHMTDGQLLVSVDGLNHTTYMLETSEQYRVVVGHQTVVFEKENDPTVLTSPSTGKLIKYLVPEGGHVSRGDPYAEMEVMKMITTLHVKESGTVQVIHML